MPDILNNRFGQYYAPGGTKDLSSTVVVSGQAGHQRRNASAARNASTKAPKSARRKK